MRISTQVFFQRNVDSVLGQQTKLSQQNMHLSTSKRVIHGSDDAVAISTIQRLKQDLSMGEQFLKNGEMAETANALEETSLQQVTNILQRVRELLVTAGNETYNAQNREAVAVELEGLREELMGVANTRDGNSQFIFAGFEVDTQPYQSNEFGTIEYHGDNGDRNYKVGPGVFVQGNDSGASVFNEIAEGNGTFVSEANINNNGSGVINEASVIDSKAANGFLSEDYTVAITETAAGADPDYSVYGLKETTVTGNATINLASVDISDPNFASFDPALYDPAVANGVTVGFVAVGPLFEVTVNGVSATPAAMYDPADTNQQSVNLNGLNFDIQGVPDVTDSYTLNKYVEPTKYTEGQSIEFNGIKTELKGNVMNTDSFALRQSGEKDIFSTIKDAIDTLRIPGEDDVASAQREMRFNMARLQVDNAMENVSGIRTSVGARMRTIDNQSESTQDFNLTNQKTLSNLEDLDMAAAISEFKMQMSLLEVSQQTFVQMQSLSLFKLI
ncbi:flagellar hook-associated protein 3 [Psychromonas sp. psych-6C06]|uniref:flagellar hook-associated protein FlgL n=1 Tax=Psychromonas sp. psych-6C06 TaxID=2058089 RepID=UPI000C33CD0D|nr:flagellar hook-associated protein FlgL [Psychromonas sp. psych-6C06]PKF62759.1 flagellar hook-associated protein 3 [Psychromonas sp. psych-6C06]